MNKETVYGKIILANRKKGYSLRTIETLKYDIQNICAIVTSQDDNLIFSGGKRKSEITFLSAISHEIRTPIHGIVNMIGLLSEAGSLNDKQKMYISCAMSSCGDLIETVSDSIDLQKIKNNSLAIINDSFDLRELLHSSVGLIHFKIEQKGLEFSMHIAENVPKMVYGDKDRIRQVLLNILGNAIKFTTKGSITVKVEQYPSRIIFSIADTGCGIKEENKNKLFTEYFQEEKYSKQGLGLGLSLSKKLVQMMGGGISVVSTFGVGSTFTIDLPLAEERYSLDESPNEDKHLSILVVDENEATRIRLRKYFRQWSITVDAVAGYKEAKKMIEDTNIYDIFLVNAIFNMGECFSFCSLVEEKFGTSKIISIGVFSGENDIFDGYITDVADKTQVYNVIQSIKKRKKSTRVFKKNVKDYRVCIVEDDDISAFALKEILTTRGVQETNMTIIDNGEQAVRKIIHAHYDIIFMDCKLKGEMDGIAVTQIVKENIPQLKIIGMTASITDEEKTRWLNSGLDGLIIKPFTAESISRTL